MPRLKVENTPSMVLVWASPQTYSPVACSTVLCSAYSLPTPLYQLAPSVISRASLTAFFRTIAPTVSTFALSTVNERTSPRVRPARRPFSDGAGRACSCARKKRALTPIRPQFSSSSRPERRVFAPRSGGIVPQRARDHSASRAASAARFGRDDESGQRRAGIRPIFSGEAWRGDRRAARDSCSGSSLRRLRPWS